MSGFIGNPVAKYGEADAHGGQRRARPDGKNFRRGKRNVRPWGR